MKSQDILVLIKILLKEPKSWNMARIAHELFMSKSEISLGIKRLKNNGLLIERIDDKATIPSEYAMKEFFIHGLKYIYPKEIGKICRGTETGSSYSLNNDINDNGEIYVWAYEFGDKKGSSIKPLYRTVPKAVEVDKELHNILSLIDIIRIGKAREVKLAKEKLYSIIDDNMEKFVL